MEEIITVESEYEQLKTKLRMLRSEVSALTARRDELLLRECPRIKAEYDARIGAMELRVFYAQNKLYELKRAIEILQAARNRQEEKSSDEAAEQAHEEYEAYEEDLKQKAEDIKNSGAYREREEEEDRRWRTGPNGAAEDGIGSEGGTEDAEPFEEKQSIGEDAGEDTGAGEDKDAEEGTHGRGDETAANPDETDGTAKKFSSRAEELRYYYRLLVKRLHPDANPNQTAEEAELLRKTMEAYKNGDLDQLKEICQTLKDSRPEEEFKDTPEDLAEMEEIIADLEKKRTVLQTEIGQIEQDYPYRWKTLLENEEEVAAIQKNLADQLDVYERQYQELMERFENLKKGEDPA